MLNKVIKSVEGSLQNKSEIVYVFPAIPCLIIFIISMISSSVYITRDREHNECTLLHPKESDYLQQYVLGSIIVGYIFLAIYSNILLEYVPKLKGLGQSFLLLIIWAIGCFVWNIIGASLISKSYCKDTSYYGISVMNLVIYFLFFGALILYSVVILITNRNDNKTATQIQPTGASKAQAVANKQQ